VQHSTANARQIRRRVNNIYIRKKSSRRQGTTNNEHIFTLIKALRVNPSTQALAPTDTITVSVVVHATVTRAASFKELRKISPGLYAPGADC